MESPPIIGFFQGVIGHLFLVDFITDPRLRNLTSFCRRSASIGAEEEKSPLPSRAFIRQLAVAIAPTCAGPCWRAPLSIYGGVCSHRASSALSFSGGR